MMPGKVNPKYLNKGDENGKKWIPAETDVSIRPGWFWRETENSQVRSPKNLVNLYYQSVGRNSLLLLNIPPNSHGLLEESDILAIDSMRKILNETFAHNLAERKTKKSLTDKSLNTFITLQENKPFIIDLGKKHSFDRILMQENIENGQSIKQGLWEYWDGTGWQLIQAFPTVGYKRLLRFNTVHASTLRLTITGSKIEKHIQLSEIGIYKASTGE
jgi:alpha-L-fucosidase